MKTLANELRNEKRTGVIPVLLAVGVLVAAYAFVNFIVRKDTLLNLPLAPMDVLLTQLLSLIHIYFGPKPLGGGQGYNVEAFQFPCRRLEQDDLTLMPLSLIHI